MTKTKLNFNQQQARLAAWSKTNGSVTRISNNSEDVIRNDNRFSRLPAGPHKFREEFSTADDVTGLHIDAYLTDVSQEVHNQMEYLLWSKAVPYYSSKKRSNLWEVQDRSNMRVQKTRYDDKAMPRTIEVGHSETAFVTIAQGLRAVVTDREIENEDEILDVDGRKTRVITENMELSLENDVASMVFGTGNYANGADGNALAAAITSLNSGLKFSNSSATIPVWLQSTWVKMVQPLTGIPLGMATMTLGLQAWTQLRNHGSVKSQLSFISYDQPLSEEQTARALGVKQCLIGQAFGNTAQFGAADSMSSIWTTDSCAVYVNPPKVDRASYTAFVLIGWDRHKAGTPYTIFKDQETKLFYSIIADGDWTGFIPLHEGQTGTQAGFLATGCV